jgi:hypothetical protein
VLAKTIPIDLNAEDHPIIEAFVTSIGGVPLHGKLLMDLG